MAKKISIAAIKGGVGKTTTAINLAACLARENTVLLVDMDPQGNASVSLGKQPGDEGMFEVMIDNSSLSSVITKTKVENLDLVANDLRLELEDHIAGVLRPKTKGDITTLKDKIEEIEHQYDYIIFDCPPNLGNSTRSALVASDGVIAIASPGQNEIFGTRLLVENAMEIVKRYNRSLQLYGILLNQYDMRSGYDRVTQHTEEVLEKHYGKKLFETKIPVNIHIKESALRRKPIDLDSSRGSLAYQGLVKELMAIV